MKRDSDAASGFSVDTKLFRELGELLVGRDSTALVELIKNAYDADATEIAIFGRSIAAAEGAGIVVTDDGVGMSPEEFSRGFLRIASRSRTGAVRRSPWFERRYTGEKGIGRLAAHKLARRLEVVTRRWSGAPRDALDGFPANGEVTATIDWDAIEELETLDEIAGSGAVEVRSRAGGGRAGTKLTLAPLRKAWTERDRARFFDEVATLTPAKALLDPPHNAFMAPPLLKSLKLRDERRSGDFAVKYLGDLAMSEGDLPASADGASWMIEIECDARDRLLKIAVAPTRKTREEYANAEPFFLRRELDEAAPAIGFQARIFQLSNGSGKGGTRAFECTTKASAYFPMETCAMTG